jgi:probable LLM family oxidoreductase
MNYENLGTTEAPTFGVDTFGDVGIGADGQPDSQAEAIRQVVAEGVLAEQVGLDYFGVGEHHRPDMAVSSPDVVLAAIAGQTNRIRLGTGVTVLSSDDPVRVYERFATLDAVSNGRAEVTLGRGSFTESFPLFGYSLADYDDLFTEKLDLFTKLQQEKPVTWSGHLRAPLDGQQAYPVTESGGVPAWVGVGGTPESVIRAAFFGLPLVIAIIGGSPQQFAPLVQLYRRALAESGQPERPIAVHSPGFLAATDELAIAQHYPSHKAAFDKIGAERGWGPVTKTQYDGLVGPRGALNVGSPETVARKIAQTMRTLGLSRFQLKYSAGLLPPQARLETIRLYGEEVVPRVKELLADGPRSAVAV